MIRKQADGHFYEKHVEYVRNLEPSAFSHCGSLVLGLAVGTSLANLVVRPAAMFLSLTALSAVFYALHFIVTHDRKVTFRRVK